MSNASLANTKPLTEEDVVRLLQDEGPLNRARRVFSSWRAKIEQASAQRRPLSPIDMRRMEFEAVRKIAYELGVRL